MEAPERGGGEALTHPKRVFLVVGEASGDALGASVVDALRERHGERIAFEGIAGEKLKQRGIESLFDLEDIAVMGLAPVVARLPTILSRLRQTVDAIVAAKPDLLIVIDSPDFCHRVARRVRAAAPDIPILGWVSPSVWAWRRGRAKAMRGYIDHLLALLPFEVETHRQLGGPPTTYVGHPLLEQAFRADPSERKLPANEPAFETVLALPGSRTGELSRHLPVLEATLVRLLELRSRREAPPLKVIMPIVPAHKQRVAAAVSSWALDVKVISDPAEKQTAFARAHGAIAASGTVTLELALARVPMIVIYRLDVLAHLFRSLVKAWTIVLPNLVWGRPVIREYIDEYAKPEPLARALDALLADTPERRAQLDAFDELHERFVAKDITGQRSGSRAADVVEQMLGLSTPS